MSDWEDAPDAGWEDASEVSKAKNAGAAGAKKVIGAVETPMRMLAGLPAYAYSGLEGLGHLMVGHGLDRAGQAVEDVQHSDINKWLSTPTTEKGKEYSENVGKLFNAPGEYAGKLGERLAPSLGMSPELGNLSLKLPTDTLMNFLPLKVPAAIKGAGKAFERPGAKGFGEIKDVAKDAHLWEDAPDKTQGVTPDTAGAGAMDKIVESQISGEQSPMRQYADPMEQMKQQLDAQRQAEVQAQLEARQKAMEMEVAQKQGLDFNAAERARQEQAGTGFADHQLDQAVREAQQTHDFVSNAHQMEIDATPHGDVPAQFGSTLEHGRIDENGIPIRADLSMEAQNLQNPLQRNLWGDELPGRTGDNGLPLTQAIDRMPPGAERTMAIDMLSGNRQRGAVDWDSIVKAFPKFSDSVVQHPVFHGTTKDFNKYSSDRLGKIPEVFGKGLFFFSKDPAFASEYAGLNGRMDGGNVRQEYLNFQNPKIVDHLSRGDKSVMQLITDARRSGNDGLIVKNWNESYGGNAGEMYIAFDRKQIANAISPIAKLINEKINQGRSSGQRGAIDIDGIGDVLRKAYGSFEKSINDLGKLKVPKTTTLDEQVRGIPGMGNAVDGLFVKPKTAADILPNILSEKDGPALWQGMQQGLSATAEKVGSSLMRYTSDWLNYVDKKTEFDYKKTVRPTQDRITALPIKDKVALSKVLLNEMFEKKQYTPEQLKSMGISDKAIEARKALRDNLDMIADRYDQSRTLLGKEPITRGEAYLASTRQGNYHVVLTSAEGRPLWHIAEHSRRDAYKFINWAKENLKDVPGVDLSSLDKHLEPGVLPGTVKSSSMHRTSNKFYNVPRDVLGAHLELAKLIDDGDPTVSAIRESIQAAAEKAGYDVTNTKQRFLDKANIRGFNGDKPWLTPEQNANSLLNSQLQTIKEGLNWSYHQEMIAQMKEVLSNPELQKAQPNNVGMVNNVLSHQLGLTKSIFKDAEDWVSHSFFGADRHGLKRVVQDMKTFTYLQQLGVSAGYVMATPLQALNSVGAAMRERGLGALSPMTTMKALGDGFTALVNDMSLELGGKASAPMTELGKQALQYAEDNGIINKLVFNAGHETPRVDNAPGTFRKAYSATMSFPEKVSRLMPFMAFVHHLNDMGKYKTPMEIFKRAEELTEFTQINFRSSEKPTLVKDLGSLGDLAYVYKGPIFNYFNQLSTYSRNAYNGVNRGKNLAALGALVGVTAYLGGALSLPLINEMDGGYNVYKTAMANWYPEKYKSDLGVKGSVISKLDKSVAYGAISDITGAQMSSRFTPNTVDVEHPLSGVAPVATEIGEQEAVAKFLGQPSRKNLVQGVYANSPPALRGLMENNLSEFKGPKRADGSQVVVNPNNIGAQRAMVNRTPEQQSYRNWGLRELNEARKVDLNKINDAEQHRVQTAVEGLTDRMFYAMVKEKDPQAVRKYGSKMLDLMPDGTKLNAALDKKISEYATTPEERMKMKANVIQNLMKIKRLQDAANK